MSDRLAGMPRFWGRNPTSVSQFRQHSRLFRILTGLLILGAIALVIVLVRIVVAGQTGPSLVAVLAWAVWTLVLFGLVCLVDVYRHVPWSVRLGLFFWGASIGALVSMFAETVVDPLLGPLGGSLGPGLVEEALKILGVILVAALVPVLFQRPMGGLLCGMMVGLGFSFLENIFYSANAITAAGENAGAAEVYGSVAINFGERGFLTGAGWHLVFTGLAGLGVAYFVAHRDRAPARRWTITLAFVLGAVLLHFLWDFGEGAQTAAGAVLVNLLNVLHFVIVALMIGYAVRAERRWLTSAVSNAEPVIDPAERATLRKHRTRRRARSVVSGNEARQRVTARQWAQIGYVDAVADGAPDSETERLARYVRILRQPASRKAGRGDIPTQRQSALGDQEHPTSESST